MSKYEDSETMAEGFRNATAKLSPKHRKEFTAYFNSLCWFDKNDVLTAMDSFEASGKQLRQDMGEQLLTGMHNGSFNEVVMRALLLAGADQKVTTRQDCFDVDYFDEYAVSPTLREAAGANALHRMINLGAEGRLISEMIDRHPDLDAKDSRGVTALMRAFRVSDIKTAKMLVEKGANTNCRDNSGATLAEYAQTPIMKAYMRSLGK